MWRIVILAVVFCAATPIRAGEVVGAVVPVVEDYVNPGRSVYFEKVVFNGMEICLLEAMSEVDAGLGEDSIGESLLVELVAGKAASFNPNFDISGAVVTVGGNSTLVDEDGNFSVGGVEPGTRVLAVEMPLVVVSAERVVSVGPGSRVAPDVYLVESSFGSHSQTVFDLDFFDEVYRSNSGVGSQGAGIPDGIVRWVSSPVQIALDVGSCQ